MTKSIISLIPKFEELLTDTLGGFYNVLTAIIDIILIYIITKIVVSVVTKIIVKVFEKNIEKHSKDKKRLETIQSLIVYIGKIAVWFVAICAILSAVGLGKTVSSLLATAGIGGVAIGFGAQSLIKDFFSGLFLIFEGQIQIGDVITVAGLTGVVEDMQLRTTKLRAATGELHTIPNGNITNVTNYTRGAVAAVVDVPMPYENTVEEVTSVLEKAMDRYADNRSEFIEKPTVIGVVEFGDSAIMLRIVAKVKKTDQVVIEREIRQCVLTAFAENNLSVPYNKLEILKAE